jgi:hypothetical protein
MRLHLLAIPLATLLLSTLSCSKQEDVKPTTTPLGKGSYMLDGGSLMNCQVSASTSARPTAGQQYDYLLVTLQTAAQPTTGGVVRLEFGKPAGQPNTAYTLASLIYFTNSSLSVGRLYSNSQAATLTETSKGVFAGTFSGTDFSIPNGTLSAGVFSDVQPN